MLRWTRILGEYSERLIEFTYNDHDQLLLDQVPVQVILHWSDGLTTLVTLLDVIHMLTADYTEVVALARRDAAQLPL